MAKLASKSSTVTWIWLWDALLLLTKHYPRVEAERMLVRAIAKRDVRRKRHPPADETVITVSTRGEASVISKTTASDLPIWRKLSGEGDDPQVLFPAIHWEESTIEAYWRGHNRAYRIKVVREDVLRLLPEGALATLPEEQPEPQEELVVRHTAAKEWITLEAQRLKRLDLIPAAITTKKAFAMLLADNMARAAKHDHLISIHPVKWAHIKNNLQGWGLWPISTIE